MPLFNIRSLEAFSKILPDMNEATTPQLSNSQISPTNSTLNLAQTDVSQDLSKVKSAGGFNLFKDQNFLNLITSPIQGNFTFTSGVGERAVPKGTKNINLTPSGKQFHAGVDLAAPKGTPVVSNLAGTIVDLGNKKDGYGNQILMKYKTSDGQEFFKRYGHLDFISKDLKKGMEIPSNTQLGGVGSTGNSSGPHLHFEVFRINDKKQKEFLDMTDLFKNSK
jgi:murein DD-endopeptidase MepM/ murein hydrolase activator NlpD